MQLIFIEIDMMFPQKIFVVIFSVHRFIQQLICYLVSFQGVILETAL